MEMTTFNNPLKGASQITLSVPLSPDRNYPYSLKPASSEYQTTGNAEWKIEISWLNNKLYVTLYCRRNLSSYTLNAVYCARLIWANNSYNLRDSHKKGYANFSGSMLETTASIDLVHDYNLPQQIMSYGTGSLQVDITCLEFKVEEMNVKIYEDAFSTVDKAQLFSPSSPYSSDCVISFKNKKEVYVNRTLLSLYSEYWKDAFDKVKKGKPLSLTNVDYNEFLELLSVIYPCGHPITAKNVETLSKLAYEFGMSELLKRCDVFLMASNEIFGKSKLLLLAQSYNLERLQAQCITQYKNIDDVKAIQKETDYVRLNLRTKRMLLDNIIGVNSPTLSQKKSTRLQVSTKKRKLMDTIGGENSSVSPGTSVPEDTQASRDLAMDEKSAAKIVEKLGSCPWLQSISCAPDIVLVVGNSRIPAHKQYLSVFSEFFDKMFQSEFKESRENEITLEEVRYDEILELLSVVYPSDKYSINEANIATIVKLADRFMMPIILERCKKELKNSDKIKGALKLWLTQRYSTLAELQKEFAYEHKYIEDVQNLTTEPEFDLLDDKMRALLLESITM